MCFPSRMKSICVYMFICVQRLVCLCACGDQRSTSGGHCSSAAVRFVLRQGFSLTWDFTSRLAGWLTTSLTGVDMGTPCPAF